MVDYIPAAHNIQRHGSGWSAINAVTAYVYPASDGMKVLMGTTEKNAASALTAILMDRRGLNKSD
ncbi:MAG: hypothetical protein ABSF81_17705 [Bacteroidales bacterium]